MFNKEWVKFFLSLARIFALIVLLAILIPKVVAVCQIWISSFTNHDERPHGNPLRVKTNDIEYSQTGLFK